MERSLPTSALPIPSAAAAAVDDNGDRGGRHQEHRNRNARMFRALARSGCESQRLHWRNALVQANLGLVRQVAARMGSGTGLWSGLGFDDLVQIGCLGLIRAVEAFDARRGVSLSSFAVPYIRGAIAHELRDRGTLLRAPRPLWELRQRATALQERRRSRRLAPLGTPALASALGCASETLAEALQLGRLSETRSLDAPLAGHDGQGEGATLLDLLPAAARSAQDGDGDSDCDGISQAWEGTNPDARMDVQRHWLRQQLAQLDPKLLNLLTGRLVTGCTWVELGHQLGLHPRMAQRRCHATLSRLQEAARQGCLDNVAGAGSGAMGFRPPR
jgi:RNA polymerase sigma-B factor